MHLVGKTGTATQRQIMVPVSGACVIGISLCEEDVCYHCSNSQSVYLSPPAQNVAFQEVKKSFPDIII